jgi:hypothetical protein
MFNNVNLDRHLGSDTESRTLRERQVAYDGASVVAKIEIGTRLEAGYDRFSVNSGLDLQTSHDSPGSEVRF